MDKSSQVIAKNGNRNQEEAILQKEFTLLKRVNSCSKVKSSLTGSRSSKNQKFGDVCFGIRIGNGPLYVQYN